MQYRSNDFETLALPLLDPLYRTSFRLLQEQVAAERCVEQTYLEAVREFHRLPESADGRVWLFTILFRTIHSRRSRWLKFFAGARFAPKPQHDDEILEALANIPAVLREVLLLADVEDFTRSEVQMILGIAPGILQSRLEDGRRRLRQALAESDPPRGGTMVLDGPTAA